jgi:hypothetical protein
MHTRRVADSPHCCLVAVQAPSFMFGHHWSNVPRIRSAYTTPPLAGMAFNSCYNVHHPNSSLNFYDISVVERSEDNRSSTCHLSIIAFVSTPVGGSHTWEWRTTCCAPAAEFVIALFVALHSRLHGLSLSLSL